MTAPNRPHVASATRDVAVGTWQGMHPAEFVRRFGGSFRSKHLAQPDARPRLTRLPGRSEPSNKRPFRLPTKTGLPRDFIRLDPWEAEYLFLVAARATRGILEVGRLHGGSTFLLACANTSVPIWSIDVAPKDDETLRRLLDRHGVGANVELLVGDSQEGTFPEIGDYDVLFVDGDHSYAGCSADLANHYPRLADGGHLVMHDAYAGSHVQQVALELIDTHDVDVIVSPYTISSHWHTTTGSIAHLRKRRSAGRESPGVQPVERRKDGRRRRPVAVVAAAAAAAVVLFAAVPEMLGDRPYDPKPSSWPLITHIAALPL